MYIRYRYKWIKKQGSINRATQPLISVLGQSEWVVVCVFFGWGVWVQVMAAADVNGSSVPVIDRLFEC